MMIYPAIDLLDRKCVRLKRGSYDEVTVYSDDPAGFADKWKEQGAKYLHLVDLNGARNGDAVNLEIIKKIASTVKMPIQTGGGIRTMKRVEELLEAGVTRVIIGTKAVVDREFVKLAVNEFKERIVIGIDAKDGFVAIDGWEKKSRFKSVEFAKAMEELGVRTVIYTDIARDGMMAGPNLPAMKEMVNNTAMNVIASGGVSKKEDLDLLALTGVEGVIIGKALYENAISLKEVANAY